MSDKQTCSINIQSNNRKQNCTVLSVAGAITYDDQKIRGEHPSQLSAKGRLNISESMNTDNATVTLAMFN